MRHRLTLALLLAPATAMAHQPVMDMAPRWSGGYGFQTRTESENKDRLELDGSRTGNPLGLKSESIIQWFEGVYTFNRSFRVTFKLPQEDLSARLLKDGQVRDLKASGLGDMILTFPIKKYVNYMTHTTNLALNPSITLPTGSTAGPLSLGRGTVDYGLSVSYAREAIRTFGLWDLSGKVHTKGADGTTNGNEIGFDMNFGIYPYQDSRRNFATLLLWGTHLRQDFRSRLSDGSPDPNSGGRLVEMAPIFVVLYQNLIFRTEAYFPVYRRLDGSQLVSDYRVNAGMGITFASLTPF